MIAVTHMIELTTERVQTADFILEVGAWCILVCFGTVQDVGNQTGELMGYVYIEMERNIKASSFSFWHNRAFKFAKSHNFNIACI